MTYVYDFSRILCSVIMKNADIFFVNYADTSVKIYWMQIYAWFVWWTIKNIRNKKSTNLNLKTSDISNHHQQGIHTTTFSEIFSLPRGMKLIDTPGIKGFGVVDMQAEEIGNYFPEFLSLKSECKFHNCLHQREPQCAVIQAFEEGNIAESRYKSYLQMLENDITFR